MCSKTYWHLFFDILHIMLLGKCYWLILKGELPLNIPHPNFLFYCVFLHKPIEQSCVTSVGLQTAHRINLILRKGNFVSKCPDKTCVLLLPDVQIRACQTAKVFSSSLNGVVIKVSCSLVDLGFVLQRPSLAWRMFPLLPVQALAGGQALLYQRWAASVYRVLF